MRRVAVPAPAEVRARASLRRRAQRASRRARRPGPDIGASIIAAPARAYAVSCRGGRAAYHAVERPGARGRGGAMARSRRHNGERPDSADSARFIAGLLRRRCRQWNRLASTREQVVAPQLDVLRSRPARESRAWAGATQRHGCRREKFTSVHECLVEIVRNCTPDRRSVAFAE